MGVRQGVVWSPTTYKFFINPLLSSMRTHNLRLHIGSVYCDLVAVVDVVFYPTTTQVAPQHKYNGRKKPKYNNPTKQNTVNKCIGI